ncbi:multidrug efflux SMR transporter [Staphylococcus coagulans]|uniref:DMT family transporter n=1 Tax=Staphylococcus coagulans TaxID=74706 RepID=UPI001BEC422B|nr:multidrug efflux SMR transporter [Staphylococcus coagulans]MBT2814738.1 multidrug efflux SMR transporter [Staphylococcus coagulans]MBT2817101.1 multidrug efflux SMR transporter [Staphylococcus coagulans]MBT2837740.1 multidrug efflux SMR transporter [Staphylococcus coagulans]MBT2842238.1 multidrug efflux SMR transporter [Staphylococcus coagulans]MBT2849009.1 multidrug efflux SMR transporter [Staphylococcus coagulans]
MSWIALIFAGLLEVLGVLWLNQFAQTHQKRYVLLLAVTFALSLFSLSLAMTTIPMGTAYAIWTGIGTAGGTILGMWIYHESKDALRISFITLIIVSAIGLRMLT